MEAKFDTITKDELTMMEVKFDTITKDELKMMESTLESADKFPNNYQDDSQKKMLERFNYILNHSDELILHSESQKKMIRQERLRLEAQ